MCKRQSKKNYIKIEYLTLDELKCMTFLDKFIFRSLALTRAGV